ncbi:hypothetical protein FBR04_19560 [Betaproteobacteria bacterium PRO7]|nr:hypothetical protein [Betaproteobacteria bacterium PRO7]
MQQDVFTPRNYRTLTPISELPFVRAAESPDRPSHWRVPPMGCYEEATRYGNHLAAHFVAYLRDNPGAIGSGLLRSIVRDMDLAEGTDSNAATIGFFEYLEVLLARAVSGVDPFEHLDELHARYDEVMAAHGYPDAEPGFLECSKLSRLAVALQGTCSYVGSRFDEVVGPGDVEHSSG